MWGTEDVMSRSRATTIVSLVTLAAVVFLTALDQTVVVTALLPMAQTLGLTAHDLSALSWVISGYLLGYVIVMPLMGRVADLLGRRRILLVCLGVFAGGSLLCAEAPRLAVWWDFTNLQAMGVHLQHPALSWLVIARFIQAVGGGAVVPITLAESGALFGAHRRSIALGFISGVTEAGGALGPLYGAIILEKWPLTWSRYPAPWMWLFLLNVPLVVLLAVLIWRTWPARSLDAAVDAGDQPAGARATIDWLGAVVLGGALLCLSLGLSQQAGAMITLSTAQQATHNPYLLAAAAGLLIAFVMIERRQPEPLIPLRFFQSGTFTASAVLSLFVGIVLVVALVNVPIFAYAVLGESYLAAGLLLLRLTVMIPVGAFAGGWLVAHLGTRTVGVGGTLVIVAGFLVMGQWTPGTHGALLTAGTAVTGLGFGLVLAPISTTALQTMVTARFGQAASISTTLRMVGMMLGLAALTSWEISRFQQRFAILRAMPPGPNCSFDCLATRLETAVKAASAQAMAETFIVAAVLAGVALISALWLRPQGRMIAASE
ncbi:MAG TPA: MFS transporter [Gemmatimonadaceae bacterium]|nr:MFS transporter [Gemmatimonadaceae bacterium]